MMDFLNAGIAVIVIAVLFMAWRIWRAGERPESLGEWAVQVEAAEQWALLAVKAAEQLYVSEQITKDGRYEHADTFLIDTLPNLNADQRQMLIESSVWALHYLRRLRPSEGAGET